MKRRKKGVRRAIPAVLLLAAILITGRYMGTGRPAGKASPVEMERWVYGITVDDCWYDGVETEAVIAAIRDIPVKPTARIVMSKEISAEDYEDLFSQIHEVAYVMACPVDSLDMSAFESEQDYLERFQDAYRVLKPYTDLWEIGNEVNGVAWIGQAPELIVKKSRPRMPGSRRRMRKRR